ncbi:MAG: type II secretion system protein, partial [Verrucomicrobiales bacterium]
MENTLNTQQQRRGFSLIELLSVVAAIAVLGSLAVVAISNTNSTVKQTKLEQEVTSLNAAIEVFLSNGGSLDGIETAQGVITELKRAAANELEIVGLRGSVVDVRLQAVEEADGEPRERAIWNSGLSKFVISESASGVREFILNDELAEVDYSNVTRKTSLIYNDADGWVWDTNDFTFVSNTGPSSVPTTGGPAFNLDGQAGSANRSKLKSPLISPGSATLALADFPLEISMAKQEGDPYSTRIYYSIEPNVWVL